MGILQWLLNKFFALKVIVLLCLTALFFVKTSADPTSMQGWYNLIQTAIYTKTRLVASCGEVCDNVEGHIAGRYGYDDEHKLAVYDKQRAKGNFRDAEQTRYENDDESTTFHFTCETIRTKFNNFMDDIGGHINKTANKNLST